MEDAPVWRVIETEPYELERDAAFLYLLRANGPEYAGDWLKSLIGATVGLAEFPGPRANPIDEKASEQFQTEVRKLIFYGSGERRRGGVRYRITYSVRDPLLPDGEGEIYLLRVRHGSSGDL